MQFNIITTQWAKYSTLQILNDTILINILWVCTSLLEVPILEDTGVKNDKIGKE